MKPVSLRIQAFGPYVNSQYIDFNSLDNTFLICGETGSGKTVILDAITYALYGKSSGGGRDNVTEMRCQLAPNNLNTEIEFIFEVRNKLYKFTRTLKFGRTKFTAEQNALYFENEVFVPFFENPKIKDVESTAENIIGLTYDQFRQVIILPQGQFERLLTAKSEEKEDILISLFGTKKWKTAADILAQQNNEIKRELESEKLIADTILNKYECSSAEEIAEYLKIQQNKSEELKAREIEIINQLDKAKKQLESFTKLEEKFRLLKDSENNLNILLTQEKEINNIRRILNTAKKTQQIKPIYDKMNSEKSEFEKWNFKKEQSLIDTKNAEKEKTFATDRLNAVKSNSKTYENNKIRLNELESTRGIYEKLDDLKQQLKKYSEEYTELFTKHNELEEKIHANKSQKLNAQSKQARLYDEYSEMFTKYLSGISGILADELKENTPCPVCGSTTHPSPAVLSQQNITEEMLNNKNTEIETSRQILIELDEQFNNLNSQGLHLKTLLDNSKALCDNTSGQMSALLENTNAEFKDTAELEAEITNVNSAVNDYEREFTEATNLFSSAEKKLVCVISEHNVNTAQAKLCEEKYLNANKIFNNALKESGFASEKAFSEALITDEKMQLLTDKEARYKADIQLVTNSINQLKAQLKDTSEPDVALQQKITQQLTEEFADIHSEIALLAEKIIQADNDIKALDKILKSYNKKYSKYLINTDFVKKLRGDSGIGIQRYVLGIMLSTVTAEANRLLSRVHSGRYRLYRTSEASGRTRKAGLELEVFDSHSGELRGVSSLSGGEKFLVSLSLSIGLSSVVQSQSGGISLNSMFIDEGFGTLDSSSVADALSVLSVMKNNDVRIGIISHIPVLRENILSKIEVIKNKNGSNIKITN